MAQDNTQSSPPLEGEVLVKYAKTVGYTPPEGKELTERRLLSFISKQEGVVIGSYPKALLKVLSDRGIIEIEAPKVPGNGDTAPAADASPGKTKAEAKAELEEKRAAEKKVAQRERKNASEKLAEAARAQDTAEKAPRLTRKHPADDAEMKAKGGCYSKLYEKGDSVCKSCPVSADCDAALQKAAAAKHADLDLPKLTKSELEQITREIQELRAGVDRENAKTYMAIGERMLRAKESLPRGEYVQWVEERLNYRHETANDILRAYRAVHEIPEDTLAQLGGIEAVYKFLGDLGLAKLSELADLGGPGLGDALLYGLPLPVEGADPAGYRKTRLDRLSFRQVRGCVRYAKGKNPFKSSDSNRGRTAKFQDLFKSLRHLEENANRILAAKVVQNAALNSDEIKQGKRLYRLLKDELIPALMSVLKGHSVKFAKDGSLER